jgi:uncharacterized protein YfaS (alpha-2-macroglobulin family)
VRLCADAGPEFFPGTEEIALVLSPGPLAEFGPAARQLIRYPYGCAEQTSSALLGLVAASAMGLEDSDARIAPFLASGIQRLASMQTRAGGLAMWPGGSRPVPWISAFVAHMLIMIREGNEILVDDMLRGLVAYLRDALGSWEGLDSRAYAAFVCALGGEDVAPQVLRLSQERLSYRASRLVSCALTLLGEDGAAAELLARRAWGEPESIKYVSEAVDRAIALLTAVKGGRMDEADAMVARLRESARSSGAWRTTHESAWALAAIGTWAGAAGAGSGGTPEVRLRVWDREVFSGTLDGSRRFDLAAADLTSVSCEVRGGPVFFSWTASGVPLERPEEAPGTGGGVEIDRTFLDLEGKVVIDRFQLGCPYVVELTVKSPSALEDVVICDLLPAGLEVENPRLASREKAGGDALRPDHMDVRDDRLLLFADIGAAKAAIFRYMVRAVAEGTFVKPPVLAECMYSPEIRGATPAGEITVERLEG